MHRWAAWTALAVVAVLIPVSEFGAASAGTSGRPDYESVGDSFTAMDGNGKWNKLPCEIAPSTYSSLVATQHSYSYSVLACSGASTNNLLEKTQSGATAPQLDEISPKATVVTILMGLNDLGDPGFRFVLELAGCELRNETSPTRQRCQSEPDMNESTLEAQIAKASAELAAGLAWLHQHRPNTRVILLSYPAISPTSACPSNYYLTSGDVALYSKVVTDLNAAIANDAAAAGDQFTDLYKPSLDAHGCPTWVAPGWATTGIPDHPTATGVRQMAASIEVGIGSP
jgi:lysophospholipase L1-like esterase